MRLIDADEFIRIFDSQELMEHLKKVGQNNLQNLSFALAQIVNNQPTAYDVGKIVEEMEIERKTANDTYDSFNMNVDLGRMFGLEKAIEIVKQGGVADDVCKWKYTKEIMDNAEFKVGCNPNALKRGIVPNNFSYHDFKYCPYCGKKIKVVE